MGESQLEDLLIYKEISFFLKSVYLIDQRTQEKNQPRLPEHCNGKWALSMHRHFPALGGTIFCVSFCWLQFFLSLIIERKIDE